MERVYLTTIGRLVTENNDYGELTEVKKDILDLLYEAEAYTEETAMDVRIIENNIYDSGLRTALLGLFYNEKYVEFTK